MILSIEQFEESWTDQWAGTHKMMAVLTDRSLSQPVTDDHRTLGRIAWHLVLSISEMMSRTGLKLTTITEDTPVPDSASEIANAYKKAAAELQAQVKANWDDAALKIEDDMYGQKWARGLTLQILINHEIHHCGQMTILMRQAGLKIPGLFGPAKEEWQQFGMTAPEI